MDFGNATMGTETAEGRRVYQAAMAEFKGAPILLAAADPEPPPEPEVDPVLARAQDLLHPYFGWDTVREIKSLGLAADFIETALHLYKLGDDTQPFSEWLDAYHALEAPVDEMADETVRAEALAESASVEIAGFVPGALMARAEAIAAIEVAEEESVDVSERIMDSIDRDGELAAEAAKEEVMSAAVSLSYETNLKDLRAAAKVAGVRGRSRMDRIALCSALGIPVPAPEEATVTVVQQAKELAAAVKPISFEEKVAYCREHAVTVSVLKHALRRFPGGSKFRGYVPDHKIHYGIPKIDEETGELVKDDKGNVIYVKRWNSRTMEPRKWMSVPRLHVWLVQDTPAS